MRTRLEVMPNIDRRMPRLSCVFLFCPSVALLNDKKNINDSSNATDRVFAIISKLHKILK